MERAGLREQFGRAAYEYFLLPAHAQKPCLSSMLGVPRSGTATLDSGRKFLSGAEGRTAPLGDARYSFGRTAAEQLFSPIDERCILYLLRAQFRTASSSSRSS